MPAIPRDPTLDATVAMRRDPYRYISRRARELDSDVFETRLLLRPTLCMTGREAAEVFYEPGRFVRAGAMPSPIRKTLFGEGGVQGLDGEEHAHRKRLFLSMMTTDRIERLAALSTEEWRRAAARWNDEETVELYAAAQEVMTRAVCRWSGVPLPEEEVPARTRDLTALFDAAASVGLRHFAARRARRESERWTASVVDAIRRGELSAGTETAAYRIAMHRDPRGDHLPERIAAVELLNVLRPTVAVAVYVVFSAHALHEHPDYRDQLGASPDGTAPFVQEVRRHYPFFPLTGAIVREDFEWQGFALPAGMRAALDLYGIDHDARIWSRPGTFRPERFVDREGDPFGFVPQGGGDHEVNHRCAGEWATIALMKSASRFLVDELDYEVPDQDLTIDFRRLPALPQSGFIMRNARLR